MNEKWYLWKTYVGNCVKIIQENSDVTSWRHIAGKDNPADICSRGMSASKLVAKDCIWQTGPAFLRKPREQWSCEMPKEDPMMNPEVTKEMNNMATALVAMLSSNLPVSRDPRQGSVENRQNGRPVRQRRSTQHPDFLYSI